VFTSENGKECSKTGSLWQAERFAFLKNTTVEEPEALRGLLVAGNALAVGDY
jgi:hypothetical protein